MKLIEIKTLSDEHDCETCGCTWAEGGTVYVDGKKVLEKEPIAHCYGGVSYSEEELLVMALKVLGINVTVDGARFHVDYHDEDYHINEGG